LAPPRADAKRQALVNSLLESARKILTGKDYPDAAKYIEGARGVLIVPELIQGGLIFGLAGGRGTLMARSQPRDWSPPASTPWARAVSACRSAPRFSEVVFIIKIGKGLQVILDTSSSSAPRRVWP
jgi:SH3 domain-containing YSC84-like protein 1